MIYLVRARGSRDECPRE